jgi:hypothetical protein
MKGLKIFTGVVGMCITLPIWFYLIYSILCAIHPDRLVWFLFWVYVPLTFLVAFMQKIIDASEKDKKATAGAK